MTARWLWTNLYKNSLFCEELIKTTKGYTCYNFRLHIMSRLLLVILIRIKSNQKEYLSMFPYIEDKQGHQYTPREFYQQFHKVWGQLMKTGYQISCLAHQVSFL
ncbi:unnamed protein product [Musa hybrid cultivar]